MRQEDLLIKLDEVQFLSFQSLSGVKILIQLNSVSQSLKLLYNL